jgi:hypothetical protein
LLPFDHNAIFSPSREKRDNIIFSEVIEPVIESVFGIIMEDVRMIVKDVGIVIEIFNS